MLVLHRARASSKKGASAAERREACAEQSAVAHELLNDVLKKLGIPPSPLLKTKEGRPYFMDLPLVDFNLSHTEGLAVCALWQVRQAPLPRVGVDTERLSPFDGAKIKAFAGRFFGPYERRFVLAAKDLRAAFTQVFVQKESYAKYQGTGLGSHLSQTDTCAPDFEKKHGVRFYAYREGDHFISLCVSNACKEQPLFFEEL